MESEDSTFIGLLGRSSSEEIQSAFHEMLHGCVRSMVLDVMMEEVSLLCGPRYSRDSDSEAYRRAGSAPGFFTHDTRTEAIQRPRVRHVGKDGKESEVRLETYAAARDETELKNALLRSLCAGVSGRDQAMLHPESKHTSKSTVSRLWVEKGAEYWEALRVRDLGSDSWIALMLDGISLGHDLTAVVALGITMDGRKQILDFVIGSSESFEVCKDLLERLKDRGFQSAARRLLVVTDGGKGIRSAVRRCFKQAVLQRCLIHKERNIKARLSKKHYGELQKLFRDLRRAQGLAEAEEALANLEDFLRKRSKAALESLQEAGEELLAFQALNVPSTLNTTFLNTNCIENPFRNVRSKIGRVKRWRAETDQPYRWLAYALLTAEKGFRRIRGHSELQVLKEALDTIEDGEGPISNRTAKVDGRLVMV